MIDPRPIATNEERAVLALLPGLANRQGLIAGATGTGKTVTLKVLAERVLSINAAREGSSGPMPPAGRWTARSGMDMRRFPMKRFFAVLVIVLAGLAYVIGYWPEHRQRQALEGQVTSLQEQLAEAQARVRLGGLLGQLLATEDAVSAQDYGQAQALSSQFFDAVGTETTRTAPGGIKEALEKVVRMRDPVTASLTRGDPETLTLLRDAESVLRSALGFSRPTTP